MTSQNRWTQEAIRALGPTTDLPTLGTIFECSRWKAYQMARQGEWARLGIKVLSIGSKYRVVVQSILDVLGYRARRHGSAGRRAAEYRVAGRPPGPAPGNSHRAIVGCRADRSRAAIVLTDHSGPDGSCPTGVRADVILRRHADRPDSPLTARQEMQQNDLVGCLIARHGPLWSAYQIGSFLLVQNGPV